MPTPVGALLRYNSYMFRDGDDYVISTYNERIAFIDERFPVAEAEEQSRRLYDRVQESAEQDKKRAMWLKLGKEVYSATDRALHIRFCRITGIMKAEYLNLLGLIKNETHNGAGTSTAESSLDEH